MILNNMACNSRPAIQYILINTDYRTDGNTEQDPRDTGDARDARLRPGPALPGGDELSIRPAAPEKSVRKIGFKQDGGD